MVRAVTVTRALGSPLLSPGASATPTPTGLIPAITAWARRAASAAGVIPVAVRKIGSLEMGTVRAPACVPVGLSIKSSASNKAPVGAVTARVPGSAVLHRTASTEPSVRLNRSPRTAAPSGTGWRM